jgi:hypothetical protein
LVARFHQPDSATNFDFGAIKLGYRNAPLTAFVRLPLPD